MITSVLCDNIKFSFISDILLSFIIKASKIYVTIVSKHWVKPRARVYSSQGYGNMVLVLVLVLVLVWTVKLHN